MLLSLSKKNLISDELLSDNIQYMCCSDYSQRFFLSISPCLFHHVTFLLWLMGNKKRPKIDKWRRKNALYLDTHWKWKTLSKTALMDKQWKYLPSANKIHTFTFAERETHLRYLISVGDVRLFSSPIAHAFITLSMWLVIRTEWESMGLACFGYFEKMKCDQWNWAILLLFSFSLSRWVSVYMFGISWKNNNPRPRFYRWIHTKLIPLLAAKKINFFFAWNTNISSQK